MAPHTSSPSPTTASQSGKLAVILATSIPALLSSPSATTTSTSSILPALSSGSSTSPAAAFPPLPSTTQVTSSLEIPPICVNSSININFTSLILRLQSIGLLSLTDPSSSASVIMAYGSDYAKEADILRFLKLDSDENLRIYSSPKGNGPTVPNPHASSLGNEKAMGGLWWWCCRNSPKFGNLSTQYVLLEYASGALVQFSYKELQRTTEGFKEKLGAGVFEAVYRGVLANKTIVAVK
ncbi:hypothetical protein HYC85_002485 [Camellia sinensis]|uniref:Protein kinase domain-containing protein n=1 Tax=Camellia sinensis TaxID=4442 RepID=A0A7J7I9T3_CAMSI|nr:hypothetical protein HYC85_002485 [Camellia sinensis]